MRRWAVDGASVGGKGKGKGGASVGGKGKGKSKGKGKGVVGGRWSVVKNLAELFFMCKMHIKSGRCAYK